MTDCEALIYGILVKNWSTAVARPVFLPINDEVKQRPLFLVADEAGQGLPPVVRP